MKLPIIVPIGLEEKYNLYKVIANADPPAYEKLWRVIPVPGTQGNAVKEGDGIDKIKQSVKTYAKITNRLQALRFHYFNSRSYKKIVQFQTPPYEKALPIRYYPDTAVSITLGLFAGAVMSLQRKSPRPLWNHVVITGDLEFNDEGKLVLKGVGEIKDKLKALEGLKGKKLFLYVWDGKSPKEDEQDTDDLQVKVFNAGDSVNAFVYFLFNPYSYLNIRSDELACEERQEKVIEHFNDECREFEPGNFIETPCFWDLCDGLITNKNLRGYYLHGPSNTGKTRLAAELARRMTWEFKVVYAPLLIRITKEIRDKIGMSGNFIHREYGNRPDRDRFNNRPYPVSPLGEDELWGLLETSFPHGFFGDGPIARENLREELNNHPYIIIVDGFNFSEFELMRVFENIYAFLFNVNKNGYFIFTSPVQMPDSNFFLNHKLGMLGIEELPEFPRLSVLDLFLACVNEKKINDKIKEVWMSGEGKRIQDLLFNEYKNFPGEIVWLAGELQNSNTSISDLVIWLEENKKTNSLTKKRAAAYYERFNEKLSEHAKILLLICLNCGPDIYIPHEDIKAELGECLDKPVIKDDEKLKKKLEEISASMDHPDEDLFFKELSNAHLLKIGPKHAAAFEDSLTYKTLLFEDDFSSGGLREKLLDLRWMFAENLKNNSPLEKLKFIIDLFEAKGIDINSPFEKEITVLHIAAKYSKYPALIRYLIDDKKADPCLKDTEKQTPLHYAGALNPDPKIIQALLEFEGIDVNSPAYDGYLPIHLAAQMNRNPKILKVLIENYADKGRKTANGLTTLHLALYRRDVVKAIAALLLKEVPEMVMAPDNRGYTPLHYAAGFAADSKILSLLLKNHADINAKAEHDYTPLHIAVKENYGRKEIIQFLVKNGACVRSPNIKGITPLHWAAIYSRGSEVISILKEKGADECGEDQDGLTPLHYAAQTNPDARSMNALTSGNQGKEAANKPDRNGYLPLHYAVCPYENEDGKMEENRAIIENLLGVTGDPNAKAEGGTTPLILAVKGNASPETVDILLKNGRVKAAVNTQDDWGRTALHYGANNRNGPVRIRLLAAGAKLDIPDEDGIMPIDAIF
jgi:ankyrin repeat protein